MNKIHIVWPLFYMTYFPWITPVFVILLSQFMVVFSYFETYDSSLWSNLILKNNLWHSINQLIKVKILLWKVLIWRWKNNSNSSRLQKSLSHPRSLISLSLQRKPWVVIYCSQDSWCLYKCANISFSLFLTHIIMYWLYTVSCIFLFTYECHFTD